MSDILTIPPDNALTAASSVPAFVSRLRSGLFVSPSGLEFPFLFDSLSRTRSKKTASHEITDSDETVIQSMGSGLQIFPMSIYFVGENCDTIADAFCNSLWNEKYAPDKPGTLYHPRWGDVPVIPFGDIEQSEEHVLGAGISRVSVVFRETKSLAFSKTAKLSQATIGKNVGSVKASSLDRASKMITNTKASYAKFKASIRNAVDTVTDALDAVKDLTQDIAQEIEAMSQDIYASINEAATPVVILAQVQELITLVTSVPTTSLDIVNAYVGMADGLINGFDSDIKTASTNQDKKNIALMAQAIASIGVCSVSLAGMSVDYEIRDDVAESLDGSVESLELYYTLMNNAVDSLSVNVVKTFLPDHDTNSGIHGVVLDTQELLLLNSFSLKSRMTYVLKSASDAVTETWKAYRDLSQLEFFCRTNKVVNDEFVELPAGRAIAVYK